MPAAVTPTGVRDGDPVALAGLCAARGPSVLAYCRHVAGDDGAADAAAEAFAAFRVGVVATTDLAELNPEALLINATRKAAASRAPRAAIGVCAVVPLLLAARADRTISAADLEVLEEHLAGCWACRAPVARFDAAERAYRDPPSALMDPGVIAAIIAAMAGAVPARDDEPAAAAVNGDDPVTPAAQAVPVVPATADAAVAETTAGGVADGPTTEFRTPDVLGPDPAAASDVAIEPAHPVRRAGIVPSLLGSLRLRPTREPALAPRVDEPEPENALLLEPVEKKPARRRQRSAARGAAGGGARIPRAVRSPAAAGVTPAPAGVLAGAGAGSRASGRSRGRGKLPLAIVLPLAVVLIALLVALFVSGVFGGDDPESSSRIAVPSDVPAQTPPADVVVVPGAREASPDEVEVAKARDRARARARRRREAAATSQATATPPPAAAPAAAASPPPAAAPAAQPPPPPPPPATADRDDGSRKVDAGSGATGAEQIPPAEDTSTVPDLAPAPEPATAP